MGLFPIQSSEYTCYSCIERNLYVLDSPSPFLHIVPHCESPARTTAGTPQCHLTAAARLLDGWFAQGSRNTHSPENPPLSH